MSRLGVARRRYHIHFGALVAGGLLHQLTVDLVPDRRVLVAILNGRGRERRRRGVGRRRDRIHFVALVACGVRLLISQYTSPVLGACVWLLCRGERERERW